MDLNFEAGFRLIRNKPVEMKSVKIKIRYASPGSFALYH